MGGYPVLRKTESIPCLRSFLMYKFIVVSGSSDGEDPVKFHKAAGS